jgi:hypothetical protein
MLLIKIIKIFSYYKKQIPLKISEIKSYILILIVGSISIALAVFFILKLLLNSLQDGFQIIAGSVISAFVTLIVNLYVPYSLRIKEAKIKVKTTVRKILNFYEYRKTDEKDLVDQIEKEYVKIITDPPIL